MQLADVAKLSLSEKLQIMELIWAELREKSESLEIPERHKSILDSRRSQVASGEMKMHRWDDVKHLIGKA